MHFILIATALTLKVFPKFFREKLFNIYIENMNSNIKKQTVIKSSNILLSIISGLLLTFSFPKFNLNWCAWFAIVPLMISTYNLTIKNRLYIGFLAGLINNITLMYWIIYPLFSYGEYNIASFFLLCIFYIYLSIYPGIFSVLFSYFCKNPIFGIFAIPAIWIDLEFVRSILFSGFPWNFLGHSQINWTVIVQIADITGVYGISYLLVLVNFIIFLSILYFKQYPLNGGRIHKNTFLFVSFYGCIVLLSVFVYGKYRINYINSQVAESKRKNIAIIQGNIDKGQKWDLRFILNTTQTYLSLSQMSVKSKPDLIVWPETAMTFNLDSHPNLSKLFRKEIPKLKTFLLVGTPSMKKNESSIKYYNSAILMSPSSEIVGQYSKHHLVPFGEYVPLKKILFFVKKITTGNDFSPAEFVAPMAWNDDKIGVQICYEIVFPHLTRSLVKQGASVIINITNDAILGDTNAPYHHFAMAQFRAIENRRSLVRAANSGISGFIDPIGNVVEKIDIFEKGYIVQGIPLTKINSFYTEHGDIFVMLCAFIIILNYILFNKYTCFKN